MRDKDLRDKVNSATAPNSAATPNSTSNPTDTLINADFTADYQSGRDFVDARAKAFGRGVKDRTAELQSAMWQFSGGKFVIAEASYGRPALPQSEEEVTTSLFGLLYGQVEVANEQI